VPFRPDAPSPDRGCARSRAMRLVMKRHRRIAALTAGSPWRARGSRAYRTPTGQLGGPQLRSSSRPEAAEQLPETRRRTRRPRSRRRQAPRAERGNPSDAHSRSAAASFN
jgi:hypothetical protein